jgi:carbamoyl-phosphate synthase large subunit
MVFEINPRLSGTTPFRCMLGFDEVDALIEHYLNGTPIPKLDYKRGYVCLRALKNVVLPDDKISVLETKHRVYNVRGDFVEGHEKR